MTFEEFRQQLKEARRAAQQRERATKQRNDYAEMQRFAHLCHLLRLQIRLMHTPDGRFVCVNGEDGRPQR